MAISLTEVQRSILGFISEFIQDKGYPPTLREIGRRFGIDSTGSVAYHLRALQRRGAIRREAGHRGLEVVEHPFRLPILGQVGAGGQVIAQEDVEGYLSLDKSSVRGAQFLLRVRGDSMIGAGILEGDLVQVRRQKTAEPGEVVVAMVEEAGVVKRLRRLGDRWALESANPDYPLITEAFEVLGKVVGLHRRYD